MTQLFHSGQAKLWHYYLLTLLFGLVVLMPTLGMCPVFQVSEAREGVVVRAILDTGEYVLPLRHGNVIPSKPILFHWVSVALNSFLGSYDEFGLRLPSALSAIALSLILFRTAHVLIGIKGALFAVLTLYSNYCFMHLAVDGRVDMLFSLFVVAAQCTWLCSAARVRAVGNGLSDISPKTYLLVGVLAGLAVLTKGPLGLILPFITITTMAVASWGRNGLRVALRLEWLITLLVGLPWYYLASTIGDEAFIARQLVFENITRFFGGSGVPSKSFWFYLQHFWSQAAPWSLACFLGLLALLARVFRGREGVEGVLGFLARSNSKQERFLLKTSAAWFCVGLLFFSLSVGKRRAYLLPLMAPFVLCFAVLLLRLEAWVENHREEFFLEWRTWLKCLAVTFWFVLPLALIGVSVALSHEGSYGLFSCSDCDVTLRSVIIALKMRATSMCLLASLFLFLSYFFFKRGLARHSCFNLLLGLLLYSQVFFAVLIPIGLTVKGITHSYKSFAAEVSEVAGDLPENVHFLKKPGDESFDGFFFYFQPSIRVIEGQHFKLTPGVTYLAKRSELDAKIPGWEENASTLISGGRLVDLIEEQLVLFRLAEG